MARRKLLTLCVAALVTLIGMTQSGSEHGVFAGQQHGGGHHHGGFAGGHGRGGGFGPFFGGFAVGIPFGPPVFLIGPGMFLAPMPVAMPNGPLMPLPPPGMLQPPLDINARGGRVKNADPGRAAQLLVIGDRLLRAGNLKKAEERYLQAMRAAPDLAAPRVH